MAIRLAVAISITAAFLMLLGYATGAFGNWQLGPILAALGAHS